MGLPLFLANYLKYLPLPISDQAKLFLLLVAIYLPFYLDGSEYRPQSRHNHFLHLFFRRIGLFLYQFFGLSPQIILPKDTQYNDPQYIFASHPHGVMSFHHAMFFMDIPGSDPLIRSIPLHKRRALSARPLFSIPILRDIILSSGAVDASLPVAKKCLSAGYSLTVLPGGEQEQLLANYNEHYIYIQKRKGFCRLSIQYNVPIVPFYCFGETSTHRTSSIFLSFRQWIAKKYLIALPIPIGWNFFFPLSTSLALHAGKPLYPPPKDESLSKEEDEMRRVNILHQQYIEAIKEIFETNKGLYGLHDKELIIG